nr:formin-2 [Nomia melanderi]
MGNLQSDAKRKTKKGKNADGTASVHGSVDGLGDTTDTGDDGETEDETPVRRPAPARPEEKLPRPTYHGKRQAPKPPGSAVRKVPQPEPEPPDDSTQNQRESNEAEYGARRSTDTAESAEATAEVDLSNTLLVPVSCPPQKQGPVVLVTDSWRLANKSHVVSEISMPPSQESSSDSVFTDPDDQGADAAKKELSDSASTTTIAATTLPVPKIQENEPSPLPPQAGESRVERMVYLLKTQSFHPLPSRIFFSINIHFLVKRQCFLQLTQRNTLHTLSDRTILFRCSSFQFYNFLWSNQMAAGRRLSSAKGKSFHAEKRKKRIVDTLISVLPEQLKSRLTEAEVEQFATRLYSRLHSDGLFGSINFDSATQNKEAAEEPPRDRRDSEKETLRKEVERLRELTKNADRATQGKSTQTSPLTVPPEQRTNDVKSRTSGDSERSSVQEIILEEPRPKTPIANGPKEAKAPKNDVIRSNLVSPLSSPASPLPPSPPAHSSAAPPPPPPPPPPPSPFLDHRPPPAPTPPAAPTFSIPPPPPLPPCPLAAQSFLGFQDSPSIPPPPPPPPPPAPSIGALGGSIPPPPPPPSTPLIGGVPPPPPPPPIGGVLGGAGIPPPPPIGCLLGGPSLPPPPPLLGASGGPPRPPPPPGGFSGSPGPCPLPAPPAGGWNPASRACMRKEPMCPEVPMKPLYWTRILVPVAQTERGSVEASDSPAQIPLWAELEEEKNLDMKEFAGLFSRQVTERKPVKKVDDITKPSKIQPAKILDSKRSKTVGILEKSLHVDFCEVENAVYNLDTSVVSLEALQQIYEIRPTAKELEEIKSFEESNPDIPLDQPEVFLKKLASINSFSERIACLMFQSEFHDAISSVSSKLTNLRTTCDFLRNSSSLRKVIALVLTLGNYMNGGNRTRGQADGFGLEILGKLRDVKSNVPGITLLHYVVRVRLDQEKDHNFEEPLPLPVPEPADIEAASNINFDNISGELERLRKELEACTKKCEAVVEADPEGSSSFKSKMDSFFSEANVELANEQEALQEARSKFKAVMLFYQYTPKGSSLDNADPNAFFVLWLGFCQDLKDIWKKEQQRIMKERMEEMRKKFENKNKVEKTKKSATGLKTRLQRLARK